MTYKEDSYYIVFFEILLLIINVVQGWSSYYMHNTYSVWKSVILSVCSLDTDKTISLQDENVWTCNTTDPECSRIRSVKNSIETSNVCIRIAFNTKSVERGALNAGSVVGNRLQRVGFQMHIFRGFSAKSCISLHTFAHKHMQMRRPKPENTSVASV